MTSLEEIKKKIEEDLKDWYVDKIDFEDNECGYQANFNDLVEKIISKLDEAYQLEVEETIDKIENYIAHHSRCDNGGNFVIEPKDYFKFINQLKPKR